MKNILRNSNFSFTKWCVALVAAGWMGMGNNSFATLNYFEDFTTAGVLTANGWTAFSSAGTSALTASSPGLSYAGLASSGNAVGMTTGEDAYKSTATSNTTGDLYASALINVSAATTGGDYFLSFYSKAATGGGYFGRVFVKSATGGYVLGLSKQTSTGVYDTVVRSFGTTYLVVVKMVRVGTNSSTTTDDTTFVFVNPVLGATEPSPTISGAVSGADTYAGIDGIALRQASTAAPTLRIGAIRYGTTWADVTPLAGGGGGTPPTVTGISPASGLAGTIVTITGTDFSGATAVNFNGVVATSFTVNSATSITATAPVGATTGPISVVTAGGTGSSSGNFTVPKLTITAPSRVNEGDISQTATVTADPAPEADLTVSVSSSSSADLRLEDFNQGPLTSVIIGAGQTTSETIYLNAPADNTVDGDASVTLTATAGGYNSGTAAVTVRNVDFNPPTIVVNKSYNSGGANGADDVVELLVIGNGTPGSTLNLQGMILKDYSNSAGSDGGGAYIFANDPLWSSVKAGTLIVLTKPGTTPPAEDVDGSDFVIKVNLSSTTYFTAGTGSFDVGGTEMVQIKASGSGQSGSTGAIHSFAIGTSSAAQVVAAPAPKLICAASGNNPFAKNSTKALADFNGTDAAQSTTSLTLGIANNADNSTYISSLRGSKDVSISIDSVVAVINENAGLQAGKITVALSQPATEDVTINLSASPSGAVTIPSTAVILNGASSASIDVTPIDDNAIAGNRVVTITGSATGWSSGNNTMTIVDVQFNSPSVVINEVVNGGTGGADVVELLVVQNNLNMVGIILKDFSTNMTGDAGRQFTFADNVLWQSVKAGTLLVLTSDAAATEDTDASDGVVTIKLTNPAYFAATGGTFDISNTDMVMIKASGSGTTGIAGAIHTFGNGPAGSLFNLANGAKLLFAAGGAGGGADNATSAIGDYNGTGVTADNTLGLANNTSNQTYITALRESSGPTAPSNLSYTPSTISGTVGTAISSLTPTVTGTVDTYSVDPALPDGLSIDAGSGVISGTPTAVAASDTYTVTAANEGGSTTATVTVTVNSADTPQEQYLASYGLVKGTPEAAGTADPDGDGLNNAGEFAFGTSPASGASRAVTQESVVGGIKIKWLQRSGISYTVKSTVNLGSAFSGPVSSTPVSPQPSGLGDYQQYEATLTGGDRGFIKVEAIVP